MLIDEDYDTYLEDDGDDYLDYVDDFPLSMEYDED